MDSCDHSKPTNPTKSREGQSPGMLFENNMKRPLCASEKKQKKKTCQVIIKQTVLGKGRLHFKWYFYVRVIV